MGYDWDLDDQVRVGPWHRFHVIQCSLRLFSPGSIMFGNFGRSISPDSIPRHFLTLRKGLQHRVRAIPSTILRLFADYDGRAHAARLRQYGQSQPDINNPFSKSHLQFFGLFGLSNRASSMIGPNVIQAIIDNSGNNWKGFPFLFALCTAASLVIWFGER